MPCTNVASQNSMHTSQFAYCNHSLLKDEKVNKLISQTSDQPVDIHASPCPPYPLFKLLPLPTTILMKLFKILNTLSWRTKLRLLSFLGLCLS
jgi:hypothetical protein